MRIKTHQPRNVHHIYELLNRIIYMRIIMSNMPWISHENGEFFLFSVRYLFVYMYKNPASRWRSVFSNGPHREKKLSNAPKAR